MRPQLKIVFEHILFVCTKSDLKVDISEERPLGRISFCDFLIEYRRDPLDFQRAEAVVSFPLGDRNSGQNFKIFMNCPKSRKCSGITQGVSRDHL